MTGTDDDDRHDDAARWRRIRDDLAGRLLLDGEAAAMLAALSINALVATQNLRVESLIGRRRVKAKRAATAVCRLLQEGQRLANGGNDEGEFIT